MCATTMTITFYQKEQAHLWLISVGVSMEDKA